MSIKLWMTASLLALCALPSLAGESEIRILSYNVKGLPWPLVSDKGQFKKIGELLAERRAQGTAPHVVVLQEGFRSEVKELVQISGYPYVIKGPGAKGKLTNSGIWILSEYPFLKSASQAFRKGNCAGSDCYANKSVMFARIQPPGAPEPMEIYNTHMNAKGSTAGVSQEEVDKIQLFQLMEIDNFMSKDSDRSLAAVFAADFNLRKATNGFAYLEPMLRMRNAGQVCLDGGCEIDPHTDPLKLVELTPDQHLFKSGRKMKVKPLYATRNFTETLPSGKPLSDHLGYEIHYQLSW